MESRVPGRARLNLPKVNHKGHEGTQRKALETRPSWNFVSFVVDGFSPAFVKLSHYLPALRLEFHHMEQIQLWAQPWWVNLLIFIPLIAFFLWRRTRLQLTWRQLLLLAIFAVAFGFGEAAVVVYLRAAFGLLPGFHGTLADVRRSAPEFYRQAETLSQFPQSLLTIEVLREAATIVMLASVALLAAAKSRERWAAFLWEFAIWDLSYYVSLWATIRWPASLRDLDVLFLIPVPWLAQIWFPVLVSMLTVLAIATCKAPFQTGVKSA
ncbi:MAG: hypothetical protein WB952_02145 [Terriglobales bacterium]